MRNLTRRSLGASVIVAIVVAIAAAPVPAMAAAREEPRTWIYEAGVACDFPLKETLIPTGYVRVKEITDATGNLVRHLQAGTTSTEVFTNMLTGATVKIRGGLFFMNQTFTPEGTTARVTGHHLLMLFTQDPAGPSVTAYVGHLVFKLTNSATREVVSFHGKSRDICAELS